MLRVGMVREVIMGCESASRGTIGVALKVGVKIWIRMGRRQNQSIKGMTT